MRFPTLPHNRSRAGDRLIFRAVSGRKMCLSPSRPRGQSHFRGLRRENWDSPRERLPKEEQRVAFACASRLPSRTLRSGCGGPVTVHGPGTGTFFGPFRAEKCACPLPAQGDRPIFADFVAKIGTVPVNGWRFPTAPHYLIEKTAPPQGAGADQEGPWRRAGSTSWRSPRPAPGPVCARKTGRRSTTAGRPTGRALPPARARSTPEPGTGRARSRESR